MVSELSFVRSCGLKLPGLFKTSKDLLNIAGSMLVCCTNFMPNFALAYRNVEVGTSRPLAMAESETCKFSFEDE